MKSFGSRLALGGIIALSYLPFWCLYRVSDFAFVVLYRVLKYRVKVSRRNLEAAFPEATTAERLRIEHAFYRHLCDVMVEAIKSFSISEKQLKARMKLLNPEFLEALRTQGIPLIGVTGHYGNWEWAAISLALQSQYKALGLYLPLKNPVMNGGMIRNRSRFNLELVSVNEVHDVMERTQHDLTMWGFIVDQSPGNPAKAYWMQFLNQETAVAAGTEKFAREYRKGVVYGRIRKLRRGYYTLEYELVCENGALLPEAELSRRHTAILERIIREQPEFWLWTHKRWKHKRPEGMTVYEALSL